MARSGNKRRLVRPTRLDRIDRSLGRDQSRSVLLRVFGKPLLQQAYHLRGMNDGISAFDHVSNTRIIQITSNDDFKPTQSHLFPSHGPTWLGNDREISAHTLLQHRSEERRVGKEARTRWDPKT